MKQTLEEIQATIDKFNKSIPAIQQQVFDEIVLLSKELETDGKNIKTSVKNLKLLARIKNKIEKIIYSPEYQAELKEYLKAYNTVAKLQNQYFKEVDNKFKPKAIMDELKTQSIQATIESLGRAGIANNVSDKIIDNIRNNITSGATFTQFNKSLRELVLDTDSGQGLLVRYTKQISTDAINQYAANYSQVITSDLGLEWFQYVGTLIETSRCFCEALVKKRYIHVSEIPRIIRGDFQEFKSSDCEINPKTKLPQGMVAGTTAANFATYRGGYNCGHQLVPVSKASVPKALVNTKPLDSKNTNKTFTTKEVEENILKLGVQKVVLKGLSQDEINTMQVSINEIAKNNKLEGLKEIITFNRKNSNARAFYSPSNKQISINLSKINQGFGSKLNTWDNKIKQTELAIETWTEKYLGKQGYNQNKVVSTINQFKKDLNKYKQNKQNNEPNLYWSMSSMQQNKQDALKATIIHEYGHHIHMKNYNANNAKFHFNKNTVPTEYAKTNRDEYFAEWYAYYKIMGEKNVPKDLLEIFKTE